MTAGDGARGGLATLFFRNRHLLTLAVAVVFVAGASALANLPRIEDPRIALRNPTVLTFLPGASAARVEALVTEKLEDRLKELSEIKEIRSTSRAGLSFIVLELQAEIDETTNEDVFSKIRDKLADAERDLPPEAFKPEFDDKRGAVAYSLLAAITWRGAGEPRLGILNRYAEDLADRLRAVPGTEVARLFGEPDEEITVTVNPDELAALGLPADRVASLIAAADVKTPAGALRTPERELLIEVTGELDSAGRVAEVPLLDTGDGAVRLGDVATVVKDWRDPPREIALVQGRRTILVGAQVEKDQRVDRWAEAARAVVENFRAGADRDVQIDIAFDQSEYTEARLAGLSNNLLAGCLVVMAVVFVSMGWRAAIIVGMALPLSAACAVFGLTFFGQQIHQMTIFGMIIAIGLLIDNAIVMTDEVGKRLQKGLTRDEAVEGAVSHLFVPLLASTLTTILGFMPIFLLPGNIGDFVGPIAISVVLALSASFFVSMTIIASLAGRFLKREEGGEKAQWWQCGMGCGPLVSIYKRTLTAATHRPLPAILSALILPIAGFGLATTLDNQFFPPADRDHFEIKIWLPGEASIARTRAVVDAVDADIAANDEVLHTDWVIGASFPTIYYNSIQRQDGNSSHAHGIVFTRDARTVKRLVPRLQADLDARFPEAQVVVTPFAQGPPTEAPVGFRIIGPGVEELRRLGDEVRRVMQDVPGVLHTRATVSGGQPKLWFDADESAVRRAGLTLADVAGQFQGNLEGRTGGSVLEDLEELPVRIRYGDEERRSLDSIASLRIVAPTGEGPGWVPASALGDLDIRPELSSITRFNGERVNNIFGYLESDVLPIEVTAEIVRRLDAEGIVMPSGYRLQTTGDSEESAEAIGLLLTYLPVLLMLMVGTLVLSFRSGTLATVIGAVAVLSIGLGMLSLWLSGFNLGFNPILGSAGLVGVAINGSIVVLAAIRANPRARAGDPHEIVNETMSSTRHILSTTFTTIGGFIPLMLFTGGDFWPPLAVVMAGGVGFSVTLSLWFTPAVYSAIYRRRRQRADEPMLPGAEVPA